MFILYPECNFDIVSCFKSDNIAFLSDPPLDRQSFEKQKIRHLKIAKKYDNNRLQSS